ASNGKRRLADDALEVGEDFALELIEVLAEGVVEVGVTVLATLERAEIRQHARKAIARDEIVGHQERQLVGRQRALAQMPHGEPARVAERLEVEPRSQQGRVVANTGAGGLAPV